MRVKRYIIALLLLCMVVAVLPVRASAATKASGQCGENVKWTKPRNALLSIDR